MHLGLNSFIVYLTWNGIQLSYVAVPILRAARPSSSPLSKWRWLPAGSPIIEMAMAICHSRRNLLHAPFHASIAPIVPCQQPAIMQQPSCTDPRSTMYLYETARCPQQKWKLPWKLPVHPIKKIVRLRLLPLLLLLVPQLLLRLLILLLCFQRRVLLLLSFYDGHYYFYTTCSITTVITTTIVEYSIFITLHG